MAAAKDQGDKPKTHTLQLSNGAVALLREVLGTPKWYEGRELRIVSAAITVLENLSDFKIPQDPEDKWEDRPYQLSLSESQRDGCKACMEFHLKGGNLRLTKQVGQLINELGLIG